MQTNEVIQHLYQDINPTMEEQTDHQEETMQTTISTTDIGLPQSANTPCSQVIQLVMMPECLQIVT